MCEELTPVAERDALKKEDRRRLQIDKVLTDRNAAVLRDAIVTFLVGGTIRRLQQRAAGQWPQKYSCLFHTEQSRSSHEWQERVRNQINIRDGRSDASDRANQCRTGTASIDGRDSIRHSPDGSYRSSVCANLTFPARPNSRRRARGPLAEPKCCAARQRTPI
jgi:hypothetical protein